MSSSFGSRGRVTILGSGVIGLTTAVLLQSQGFDCQIVTKSSPQQWDNDPLYTSPKAGAHWRSVATLDDTRLKRWDRKTFEVMMKLVSNPSAGLMKTPGYEVNDHVPNEPDPFFKDFIPNFKMMDEKDLPPGQAFGFQYETVCIDVPVYLKWLLDNALEMGATIIHKNVEHISDLFYDADIVVNCSGYQAKFLGGVKDDKIYPTRGQTVLVRAPQVKYTITTGDSDAVMQPSGDTEAQSKFTYVIPRPSGEVVLGGTYQPDNGSLEVCKETAEGIIKRCLKICPELLNSDGKVDIIQHKVGLRPTRKGGARLESENVTLKGGRRVLLVHNYGHGGGGYQSSWGAGDDVLEIVSEYSTSLSLASRVASVFMGRL